MNDKSKFKMKSSSKKNKIKYIFRLEDKEAVHLCETKMDKY